LFGEDKTDFAVSSKNAMIKPPAGKFEPKLNVQSASDLKDAEIHGQTAKRYGGSAAKKKDPALMANGADWKNVHMNPMLNNSPHKGKNVDNEQCNKTKKYQ
jgi:hypothetical protein